MYRSINNLQSQEEGVSLEKKPKRAEINIALSIIKVKPAYLYERNQALKHDDESLLER